MWLDKPPVELPHQRTCERCGLRFRAFRSYLGGDELLTCPFCDYRNRGPKEERDHTYTAMVIVFGGGYALWCLWRFLG
jgi:hypothetical protein